MESGNPCQVFELRYWHFIGPASRKSPSCKRILTHHMNPNLADGVGSLRKSFHTLLLLIGVVLGALTLVNLFSTGLSTALHGLPQVILQWYRLVFHGIIDLVIVPLGLELPSWSKDLISGYFVTGFIVLRAMAIHGGLTWIDELAGTSFNESMLARLSYTLLGSKRRNLWMASTYWTVPVGSAVIVVGWPIVVPMLYREWTIDAELARQDSDKCFARVPRSPMMEDEYQEAVYFLEQAADSDSEMYMSFMERNAFLLALSLSANLVIIGTIVIFIWSEISIQP